MKKAYPDAHYTVWKNEQGLPYAYDKNTGYMVFVTLFVGGQEIQAFLPVMDEGYKTLKNPTMNDINNSIMRCLVKACAFAGLGMNVYAGQEHNDFLEGVPVEKEEPKKTVPKTASNQDMSKAPTCEDIRKRIEELGIPVEQVVAKFKKARLEDFTRSELIMTDSLCNKYAKKHGKQ